MQIEALNNPAMQLPENRFSNSLRNIILRTAYLSKDWNYLGENV